ncbi:hypothetical protein I4F81_011387 [Pyropia yezoensis]|uniref:Uncharacterized protein n=1 Tax=Pyropia yezoensis TaxID=2788 RepID=A0ACC3CFD0_PYRYE|nr:hypothetical protein I4F81_011387 [Neopyropia yezoensis]
MVHGETHRRRLPHLPSVRAAAATAPPRLSLVTGANRGLGLAVATALADRGDAVLACTRHPPVVGARAAYTVAAADAAAAGNYDESVDGSRDGERDGGVDGECDSGDGPFPPTARVRVLDVTDKSSVAALPATVDADAAAGGGGLDVAVLNAGVCPGSGSGGGGSSSGSHEAADLTAALATNFYATRSVVAALLPALCRSADPRLVVVPSGDGELAFLATPLRVALDGAAAGAEAAAAAAVAAAAAAAAADGGEAMCEAHAGGRGGGVQRRQWWRQRRCRTRGQLR